MRYILLNAAPQTGKGWVTRQILNLNPSNYKTDSFAAPIRKVVGAFFGVDLLDHDTYERFKKDTIDGMTGRQWMIHFGNFGRSVNLHHWSARLHERTRNMKSGTLIVVDDWGFEDEYQYLSSREDASVLSVYIGEDHANSHYSQFAGDSRFRCTKYCTIRVHDSNAAYAAIKAALLRRGW